MLFRESYCLLRMVFIAFFIVARTLCADPMILRVDEADHVTGTIPDAFKDETESPLPTAPGMMVGDRAIFLTKTMAGPTLQSAILKLDQEGAVEIWMRLDTPEIDWNADKKPFVLPEIIRFAPAKGADSSRVQLAAKFLGPGQNALMLDIAGPSGEARDRLKAYMPCPDLATGTWHQVFMTWRHNGMMRVYLDGRLRFASVYGIPPPTLHGRVISVGKASGIGALTIDQAAFFDRELTPDEVAERYLTRRPEARAAVLADLHPVVPDEPAPWAQRLGLEALAPDYVPSEWEPLSLAGQTVSSSWKQVEFGTQGLPSRIQVAGRDLLRDTVKLVVETETGRVAFTPRADASFEKIGNGLVRGHVVSESDGIILTVTTGIEYDFHMLQSIELSPVGAPVTLRRVTLRYPVSDQQVRLCSYRLDTPSVMMPGVENHKLVHMKRLNPDENLALGFSPYLWLGSTDAGLSWNFESVRGWHVAEDDVFMYLSRSNGVEVVFNLVTEPVTLDQVIHISGSFQPTPLKKLPPNWRKWNFAARTLFEDETSNSAHPKIPRPEVNSLIYWHSLWELGRNSFWGGFRDPERLRDAVRRDHARGCTILGYTQGIQTTVGLFGEKDGRKIYYENPWIAEAASRWELMPNVNTRFYPDAETLRVSDPEEWAVFWNHERVTEKGKNNILARPCDEVGDMQAWWVDRMVNDFGIDGIYMDSGTVRANYAFDGVDRGAGFLDHNGTLRPTYHFSDARRTAKRLYHVIKSRNPEGIVLYHSSGLRPVPYMSFMNVVLYGEHYYHLYQEYQPPVLEDGSLDGAYYYAHVFGDIDNLQPEFFSRQWGVVNLFLPEVRGLRGKAFANSQKGTRTMLAYILHFDTLIWPNWCATKEIYDWWRIRDAFDISETADQSVEFIPYWENDQILTGDRQAPVSFYSKMRHDGGTDALIIVSNLRFEPANISFELAGTLKSRRLVVAGSQHPLVTGEGNHTTLHMEPYDFAILQLDEELSATVAEDGLPPATVVSQ